MNQVVFVFESGKPFNYRAFADHVKKCPNAKWESWGGYNHRWIHRPRFLKAIEVELNVSNEESQEIADTMVSLGFFAVSSDFSQYIRTIEE